MDNNKSPLLSIKNLEVAFGLSPEPLTSVVHEIFTIYPNGTVEREMKSARNTRIEQWRSNKFATHQKIRLLDDGIDHGKVNWGNHNEGEILYVKGTPIVNENKLEKPVNLLNCVEKCSSRRSS